MQKLHQKTKIKCTQSYKMIEARIHIERNEKRTVKMGLHTVQCILKVIGFLSEFAHWKKWNALKNRINTKFYL